MTNELIYIDGQEGFIDLDFFIQMDVLNSYNTEQFEDAKYKYGNFDDNKKVLHLIHRVEKNQMSGWYRVESRKDMKCYYGSIGITNADGVELKRRVTVLGISRNNVSKEFSKVSNFYDKEIDYWNERISYYRTAKAKNSNLESYHRKKKIKECTKNIRRMFRFKRKNPWLSDYEEELSLVFDLLKKCPKRFYTIYKEVFTGVGDKCRFDIYLLKASSKMIPYLEQQLQLKRITLKPEEEKMLFALKEAMRIKDDKMTFDDYIDNWTKRLLRDRKI